MIRPLIRRPWNAEEWAGFARRCVALRRRVEAAVESIPCNRGIPAADVNGLVEVHRRVREAIATAEALALRQRPGIAPGIFRGDGDRVLERRGRGPYRGQPLLSQRQWIALGLEVKAIDREAQALRAVLTTTPGSDGTRHRLRSVERAIDHARRRLEAARARERPVGPL